MRFPKAIAALCGAWLAVFFVAVSRPAAQAAPTPGEYKPPPAPEQPIAYNHRLHLAQGLECLTCHVTAETGDHATLPPTATCMRCHVRVKTESPDIQKLTSFDSRKEDVPWRRVYRLAEYVYFSHKVHLSSDKSVTCQTCHGNVREMDVMQKVKDTSMAACTECHKQHSAPVKCDTCHEPRG
jgi:hypothetical protein